MTHPQPRLDAGALVPATYRAFAAADRATRKGDLPPEIGELVRLRASQINGCGFCVDMHAHDAREAVLAIADPVLRDLL